MSCKIHVQPSGHEFDAEAGETILEAALRNGFAFPYGCRNGACGSCKGKVVSGEVRYVIPPRALSEEDAANGVAVFCKALPQGDVTVYVKEVGASKDIVVKTLPCRVTKMEKLAPDVMRLYLKLPQVERLQFLAGQYLDILLRDGRRRGFSIANAPHNDEFLELHVRRIDGGFFTNFVFEEMKEKALLRIEAPLGGFYLREDSDRPVILVAGGTGFAPMKAILEHAFAEGIKRPIHLYWGVRDRASLYLADLAEQWAKENSNFRFTPVLSEPKPDDAWTGRTGFVHQAVVDDHADLSGYDVYASGPPVMVEAGSKAFAAAGLPEDQYYFDSFEFAEA